MKKLGFLGNEAPGLSEAFALGAALLDLDDPGFDALEVGLEAAEFVLVRRSVNLEENDCKRFVVGFAIDAGGGDSM